LFIPQLDFAGALLVELIEEFAKNLRVLLVGRRQHHGEELDGLMLGTAADMGFAAAREYRLRLHDLSASGGSISRPDFTPLMK
jgi:protease PrsW